MFSGQVGIEGSGSAADDLYVIDYNTLVQWTEFSKGDFPGRYILDRQIYNEKQFGNFIGGWPPGSSPAEVLRNGSFQEGGAHRKIVLYKSHDGFALASPRGEGKTDFVRCSERQRLEDNADVIFGPIDWIE